MIVQRFSNEELVKRKFMSEYMTWDEFEKEIDKEIDRLFEKVRNRDLDELMEDYTSAKAS